MLNALTIAGFDPSGGAGVLADARTFAAFGYRPSAVITSITFQNDKCGRGAMHQTAAVVRDQISTLLDEFSYACVKVGMLPTREVIRQVAGLFQQDDVPSAIVDPVMITSSGLRLMQEDALEMFISEMLPVARLVTPNIPEAAALSGVTISNEAQMEQAARIIRRLGARAVLIKGGHLKDPGEAIDFLDDAGQVTVFRAPFLPGVRLRGSGCILSSGIAAGLGKGNTLEDSVRQAKEFVLAQLREAAQNQ
jgi:hydroxymethylpyrimidine kinase/phosphomethylpyrimidine kinase